MHYLILKNIIETTVQHYRCAQCSSGINESQIIIEHSDSVAADLRLVCPQCGTQAHVRAAIQAIGGTDGTPLTLSGSSPKSEPQVLIRDQDISTLAKDIGSCSSLKDLLQ